MGEVRYESPRNLNVPPDEQISSEDISVAQVHEADEVIEVAAGSSHQEIFSSSRGLLPGLPTNFFSARRQEPRLFRSSFLIAHPLASPRFRHKPVHHN